MQTSGKKRNKVQQSTKKTLKTRKQDFELWNPATYGIRNPQIWNPESKTFLDYLTWGQSVLATGKFDLQCKIKETLLIREFKPSLNENVGSEKLFFY